MQTKTNQAGAQIQMIATGGVGEAYRIGQYWAEKLAYGATLRSISLAVMKNNKGWRVTIKYDAKESTHESTLP